MLSSRCTVIPCLLNLSSATSYQFSQRLNASRPVSQNRQSTLLAFKPAFHLIRMADLPVAKVASTDRVGSKNSVAEDEDSVIHREEDVSEDGQEGTATANACDDGSAAKNAEAANPRDPLYFRRKKFAMIIGYCGTGYRGLQWAHGAKTIERDLFIAMAEGNILPSTALSHPSNFNFQRCARTDKGVSAVSNIMSLSLATAVAEHAKEYTNKHLPPQIRVFDVIRTTKGFNAKNSCSSRTYLYIMPTFALAPVEHTLKIDYRLSDEIKDAVIDKVNKLCDKYVGTKHFHNFTREVKPWEATGQRYIMKCECSAPFIRDDIEFVQFTVRGQSFMMHQIRKMIGLIVAVQRDAVSEDVFDQVFGACKVRVPKVPGLGLLLEQVHMEHYNQRFCDDGSHKPVELGSDIAAEVAAFKENSILSNIARGEKEDLSMLTWLSELAKYKVAVREYVETRQATRTDVGLASEVAYHAARELDDSSASEDDSAEENDEDDEELVNDADQAADGEAKTNSKGKNYRRRDNRGGKGGKQKRNIVEVF